MTDCVDCLLEEHISHIGNYMFQGTSLCAKHLKDRIRKEESRKMTWICKCGWINNDEFKECGDCAEKRN